MIKILVGLYFVLAVVWTFKAHADNVVVYEPPSDVKPPKEDSVKLKMASRR